MLSRANDLGLYHHPTPSQRGKSTYPPPLLLPLIQQRDFAREEKRLQLVLLLFGLLLLALLPGLLRVFFAVFDFPPS